MCQQSLVGADVAGGLDVGSGIEPIEVDFDWLPEAADVGGCCIR